MAERARPWSHVTRLAAAACLLASGAGCAGTTVFFDDSGSNTGEGGAHDQAGPEAGLGSNDAYPDSFGGDTGHIDGARDSGPGDSSADAPLVCVIGSATYPSGTVNASDPCQTCDPAKNASAWTAAADGSSCGTGMVCHAGGCDSGCFIGGFDAPGAANPLDACQTCQPATSTTSWTVESDGSPCGSGEVCSGGTCTAGCYIGLKVYASGASNPLDPCQSCQPATSTTVWENVTDETACAGGSCCSGTCVDEATDSSHCGGCSNSCPGVTDGTPDCVSSVCGVVCDPGYMLSGTSCVPSSSGTCTVTFPDTISTTGGTDYPGTLGSGGATEYRWHAGDYLSQAFTCSNATITQLSVSFSMEDATDSFCTGTLDWNVLVNGTVVGTYSWLGGAGLGTQTVVQSYTFPAIAAIAGTYTLEYYSTTTVCSGGGNWNWDPGGSAVMN